MGRLTRDWTDKDRGKRRSAEVVAENVYFGDSKRDVPNSGTPAQGTGDFEEVPEDGELPF